MTDPTWLAKVLEIERCALAAWPAEHVEQLAGWRLRAMSGVTRRANSVWACEATDALTLDERIERVGQFYRARNLPAFVQITPASIPTGLDAALERRGYVIEARVSVQVAALSERALRSAAAEPAKAELLIAREPSEAWLALSARQGRYQDVEPIYRGLLARLGPSAHYALAVVAGTPAAVALGVAQGAWFGVCSMLTLPSHRRLGLGRYLLSGLAGRAQELGCRSLYLQVETENTGASALYQGSGFRHLYGTYYRREPGV